MKNYRNIFCFMFLLLFFVGCKQDEQVSAEKEMTDHLENIVKNGVGPTFSQAKVSLGELYNQSVSFKDNPNAEALDNLRTQFKEAMLNWKACEIYNMGDVKSSYLYGTINFWPANPELIEQKLADATEDGLQITEDFINKQGAPLKSMSAVEYLLFKGDTSAVLSEFSSNQNRRDYLVGILNFLVNRLDKIDNKWKEYGPVFVVPNRKDKLNDGYSVALNTVVQQLENIKNLKLGDPLGDKTGAVNNEKLEAYRSRISLEIIEKNVEQIGYMLFGNYPNSENEIGFDDYFSKIDKEYLNPEMTERFNAIQNNITELKGQSLFVTINSETPKVKELQSSVQNLLRFAKKDMKQALEVIIIISDTDGD